MNDSEQYNRQLLAEQTQDNENPLKSCSTTSEHVNLGPRFQSFVTNREAYMRIGNTNKMSDV